MEKNIVGWFEIYVDDMSRAQKFYEAVFQKELMNLDPPGEDGNDMLMRAFPWVEEAPYAAGAIVKSEMQKPGGSGTIVYFDCQDCSVEEGRVTGAGGEVLMPKMSIGEYGFVSLVKDTEGNTIGLHSKV